MRSKTGEETVRQQYNELVRTVKRLTKRAKDSYEFKVASKAKTYPKGFYQIYRTTNRETIGPLKTVNWELVNSGMDVQDAA